MDFEYSQRPVEVPSEEKKKRHWTEISPEEAKDIVLPHPDIQGPLNMVDQICPWPWEPQQLKGTPMGQYHCPYCGDMVMAGVPHPDYTDFVWAALSEETQEFNEEDII